jgi:hypothetical protein
VGAAVPRSPPTPGELAETGEDLNSSPWPWDTAPFATASPAPRSRGTIVHRVELAPDTTLIRVKVVDPLFLDWPALPVALADTIVPAP